MKLNGDKLGAIIYPAIYFAMIITLFIILPMTAKAETFYATITNVQPRYHIVNNSVPTKQCYETQVPIYGQTQGEGASGGDVLGGAIIGGILGKALTDNDKGAAFGAIVLSLIHI